MYMTRETIIELYQKAKEEGKGPQQIKALAKANQVDPGQIKKILCDAGEYVPRQKPGPKPKAKTAAGEEQEKKMAAGEEQEKRTAEEPQTAKVEINIFLKEIMRRGLKDLKKEMEEKRHKVEDLKSDLDQLKSWHDSEAQELDKLEKSYAWALAEYAGIIFKEGIDIENAQGPETGQLAEQRSGD